MTKPPVQGRQPSTVRAPDGLSPTAPASASRIAPTSQTPVYDSEQREMDAGTRRAFSPAALAEIEAVNQRRLQAATEASRRYRQKELERDLSRARGQVVR